MRGYSVITGNLNSNASQASTAASKSVRELPAGACSPVALEMKT